MTDIVLGRPVTPPRPLLVERMMRRAVLSRLEALRGGSLTVHEGGGTTRLGSGSPQIDVRVHDPRFWAAVSLRGSVGAGESFMAGHWETGDLVGLMRLMVRNEAAMQSLETGLARIAAAALAWYHRLRRNDRAGSRRNISAHYDLGNDFFRLFLDESLTYSSGVFPRPGATLHEAQTEKLDRICRALGLGLGDSVVEIGTGWGSFALHAAGRYGCHVTTTTISAEQERVARERVVAAGFGDRVDLRLADYRDLGGTFDHLVSIEMIEAVGYEFLDTYFAKCASLLRPGGSALIQAIVIAEPFHDVARKGVDFIKRHVFPGCYIPSLGSLKASLARVGGLDVDDVVDIGPHYAETLRIWRERFLARRADAAALGYPEEFLRMWEFYLAYCEGGFREERLSDVHMLLRRSGSS